MEFLEDLSYSRFDDKNKNFFKHDLQKSRNSSEDFSIELRKRKRKIGQLKKRFEADSTLEEFLTTEKRFKTRLSTERIEVLVKSVFQELNALGYDVYTKKLLITREVLKDFLFICEDCFDILEYLHDEEIVDIFVKLKYFCDIHMNFFLAIRVSSISETLKKFVNDPQLKPVFYPPILALLGLVIKKDDLDTSGSVNVLKIVNEQLKSQPKLPDDVFVFMAKVLENNSELVENYDELGYVCTNINQFIHLKKLSGLQFSIIFSGIMSVDCQRFREHFGMIIIDYLAICMRISSDMAKLNCLVCIQRFVIANKANCLTVLYNDIFKLVLDCLNFSPLEVSVEASRTLNVLTSALEFNMKCFLVKYKMIDAIFNKLQQKQLSIDIIYNFLDILENLKDVIVQTLAVSFRNELGSALVDAAGDFALEAKAKELQVELAKV